MEPVQAGEWSDMAGNGVTTFDISIEAVDVSHLQPNGHLDDDAFLSVPPQLDFINSHAMGVHPGPSIRRAPARGICSPVCVCVSFVFRVIVCACVIAT